jgi:hypothetical protein
MGILWTILIGFIAGVLAKLITPGDNEPSGLATSSAHARRSNTRLFDAAGFRSDDMAIKI